MGVGGVDNRVAPPWTVEYTIQDASQLVDNGGYLINRFWKPGFAVIDWVQINRSSSLIRIGVPDGSEPVFLLDAGIIQSLRVKYDLGIAGLTVYVATNGGVYGAGRFKEWQSPVDASTIIGVNIAAMDMFGPTVIGPLEIAIDDLVLSGANLADDGDPDSVDHPLWNP